MVDLLKYNDSEIQSIIQSLETYKKWPTTFKERILHHYISEVRVALSIKEMGGNYDHYIKYTNARPRSIYLKLIREIFSK